MSNNRPSSDAASVSADDFARRVIEPSEFVADTSAFIDVRLPRSAGKASYSFIGPGVSQNPDQTINLVEPHGFNIGAASMNHGVVNNPHLHFTAEVFLCTKGSWMFAVGEDGGQKLEVGANTIFSVPTWVFRGFENIGDDDGWLFTVLGGDDTGGILWAPHILREAAATGLYLNSDLSVLDANAGDNVSEAIAALSAEDLAGHVDSYSDAELAARAVAFDDLTWSQGALLSAKIGRQHRSAMAPVIGFGMSQDRHQLAPIGNRHGFSIEWLAIEPGSSTGLHMVSQPQVLFAVDQGLSVQVNRGDDALNSSPAAGSVVSLAPGCWRNLGNESDQVVHAVVVTSGDERADLTWDDDLAKAARDAGWACDANGYLAPVHLLGRTER